MITLDQLRKYGSKKGTSAYLELVADLDRGKITEKELWGVYSRFRKTIMAQVRKIEKSDIGFLPGTEPYMREKTKLVTTRDMVHEIADALRFYHSKSYSRPQRVAQRAAAIQALKAHGIDIPLERWDDWRRFMQWFYHTEYAALYDSDSEITLQVLANGNNSLEWERLFMEYKANYMTKGL